MSPIVSCFDPDNPNGPIAPPLPTDPGASLLMGQMSHRESERIRHMLAESPAMGMADLALKLFKDSGTADWPGFTTVLITMGLDEAQIRTHLSEARDLYARAIAESQKVIDRAEEIPS